MFKQCFATCAALLAAAAFALSPGTADARGPGGHGGGGHGGFHGGGGYQGGGGYHGGGYHGGGYHGGYYGGGSYHGGYYGHHGGYYGNHGWVGGGWGLGLASPWYSNYGYWPNYYGGTGYYDTYPSYSDTTSFYYSPPGYDYSAAPAIDYGASTLSAPAPDNACYLRILVPPDAQVWFENVLTKQGGSVRLFTSPPLTPGKEYSYDIKAQWRQGDHDVTRTQHVDVHANSAVTVDLTRPAAAEKTTTDAVSP